MSPEDVAKTYLYLRVGLIGAAVFLLVSVGIEILNVWEAKNDFCLQPSISAYYYTPVRSVFVGALLMVSIALIVIQGDGIEDLWLTLAGMLAPVVALVPTPNPGECISTEVNLDPRVKGDLADWLVAIVNNNFKALLIVGALAWVAAFFMLVAMARSSGRSAAVSAWVGWGTVGVVLLVYTIWFFGNRAFFDGWAHNLSAIFMFVFLFVATLVSGLRCAQKERNKYAFAYLALAAMMAATGVFVGGIGALGELERIDKWQHWVFTLEATEIFIFASYWIIQTWEHRPRSFSELTSNGVRQ